MNNNFDLNRLKLLDINERNVFIDYVIKSDNTIVVGFMNQHGYNFYLESNDFRTSIDNIDYIFRDGLGIKLACKLNGIDPKLNLNGTDLIPYIITRFSFFQDNSVIFVFGTEEPWLSKGSYKLFSNSDQLVLKNGFFDYEIYLELIRGNYCPGKKHFILLAMGMPKQERLANLIKKEFPKDVLIVCGGAIVDFAANRFSRAPMFMRKLGLEWLYRLFVEPSRLFKRYVLGIPLFLYRVLVFKFRG